MALAAAGLFALFAAGSYNRLIALGRRCDQAFADIDVQLRHRHDLIPNLVETVKGFAAHEKETLGTIMQARAAAMRAVSPEAQMTAEAALSSGLGQLFSVVEQNPELKGSQHFMDLRREIADTEHKIAAARRFLNLAVTEYNTSIAQFPANTFSARMGLLPRRTFDLGLERVFVEEAPAVRFS